MNSELKQSFISRWEKYFGAADLPITFEYTDEDRQAETAVATAQTRCLIAALQSVRDGNSLSFSAKSIGCTGGKFYSGYAARLRPNINYFLSCGIEGELEGERYKKTPEAAAEAIRQVPWYEAPAAHMVFKRWDKLESSDYPEVVIFYATPDIMSGLFTLAGFDESGLQGAVICPFGSGCAAIIQYPYAESRAEHPRAVLGMFDVSARPHIPGGRELTLAVPMKKFEAMVANMDESFLITESWARVRERISNCS